MTPFVDFTLYDTSFKMTEEGAGAAWCFHPDRPEATDRGLTGMVAEMEAFARLTRGRKRLLDVGALFGVFSLVFTSRPGTSAVALEPSPWAWDTLCAQINANPDREIRALQVFAGEKQREVVVGRNWQHAILNLNSPDKANVFETPIDNIDIGDFDTMKIDVEAYETQVFRGACKLIERCKPLIFLELHGASLPDVGESLESLRSLIYSLGYRITDYAGNPIHRLEDLRPDSMARVLCVPE